MTATTRMKSVAILGLLTCVGMFFPQTTFAAGKCKVKTLDDSYAFTSDGYIAFGLAPPLQVGSFFPVAVVGTLKFQADGKVNRSVSINAGGLVGPVVDQGTYVLNDDCTFTVNHGNGEVWNLVPSHGDERLDVFIVSVPGATGVGRGVLNKQ
jgi:hypothetical protein